MLVLAGDRTVPQGSAVVARYFLKEEDMPYYLAWSTAEAGLKHQREVLEGWLEAGVDEWRIEGQRCWIERCERDAMTAKAELMERVWTEE